MKFLYAFNYRDITEKHTDIRATHKFDQPMH